MLKIKSILICTKFSEIVILYNIQNSTATYTYLRRSIFLKNIFWFHRWSEATERLQVVQEGDGGEDHTWSETENTSWRETETDSIHQISRSNKCDLHTQGFPYAYQGIYGTWRRRGERQIFFDYYFHWWL